MTVRPQKPQGFALVVAVVLLGFVMLILVSLSALVQTELHLSSSRLSMSEARSNALLGLEVALGRLQASSGPDQRATARADILGDTTEENRYWTGVWKTIDPDNPRQELEAVRSWSTQPDEVEWLISSEKSPNPNASLADSNPSSGVVSLVNYIDAETDEEAEVQAGKIPLPLNGSQGGNFAWWVGDEGIKAKFNTAGGQSPAAGAGEEWLQAQSALLNPERFGMAAMDGLSDLFDYASLSAGERAQVYSDEDIGFLADGTVTSESIDAFRKESFHDITFSSFGVLSNQRFGGLKKDLSRGLDDQFPETLAGRPMWWLPEPGTSHVVKGELWDVVYDYANLYRDYPAWQFSGSVNDSGYTYSYNPHGRNGPQGLSDPRDASASVPMRFFGPESSTSQGSFNRQGKNMGANSYYIAPVISQYQENHWDVSESGTKQGRPIWNALNPVVLACLWRVGIGSVDLTTYSQSEAFTRDGYSPDGTFANLLQYDEVAGKPKYDFNGSSYTGHPLDLPRDWQGRPSTGEHAVQGTPKEYYRLHFVLQPIIVLWNPYNVPLKINDLEITPKFEPWVSIDFDPKDGTGSGVKPVKLHKYMYTGSTKFRVLDDYPHSAVGASNNPSEADDRFLLIDDALMAGGQYKAGIQINNEILQPGEILVFSSDKNRKLAVTTGIPVKAARGEGPNTDAVALREFPIKHDFPQGTHINSIQLFYEPSNVPNRNQVDGRLNTMSLSVQYQNQDFSPGTQTEGYLFQFDQFGPDAVEGEDWLEKHEFEVDLNIEDIQVPYTNLALDMNDYFDVHWFAVIGAQTKRINENLRGAPLFSQFNVTRVADRPNPSNTEMSGLLWKAKFYTDPEFQDAIESDEIPFWNGDDQIWNDVDHVVLKELPRQPLSSIGQFMHAGLSVNDWDPLYAVGSSYAHPLIAPNGLINKFNQQAGTNGIGTTGNIAVDLAYLSNERLFDDFFFSTVPPQNTDPGAPGYSSTYEPEEVPPFEAFSTEDLELSKPLPNPRMRYLLPEDDTGYTVLLEDMRDYDSAASVLMVDGAFNVNSTSVEAWEAVLSSLRNQMIPSASGGQNTAGGSADNPFLRVSAPLGGNDNSTEDLYTGFASLSDDEIRELAEAVVTEVKTRGPFLSMADFVNRRLEDTELGYKGALQAALDKSVNADSDRFGSPVTLSNSGDDSNLWLNDKQGNRLLRPEVLVSRQGAGLPQWILQNDILRSFASIMQARSDTFIIRSYGDVTDITGKPIAQAWCEAVVQRMPDYVDSLANPDPTVRPWLLSVNGNGERLDEIVRNTGSGSGALSETNFDFGRRYRIVSFRWLNEGEI